MAVSGYLLALLFLPLFPFSMVFNRVLGATRGGGVPRVTLLLVWPQLGLTALAAGDGSLPSWLAPWALLTAVLYAFRAIALRDVGQWIGFLATSAWALLWIPLLEGRDLPSLHLHAFGFSAPLAMLALLGGALERRLGAAYTGIHGGLALALPRLSGVLVITVLAVTAVPVTPGFFTMLGAIVATVPDSAPVAAGLAGVWLLWTWAGARLIQGLVVGESPGRVVPDLGRAGTTGFALALIALAVGGGFLGGTLW